MTSSIKRRVYSKFFHIRYDFKFRKVYISILLAQAHIYIIDYSEFISAEGYICDGSRNINHETAFQNYLEKYFGFRRVYCRLHICYNPKISLQIKILFPLRKVLYVFDKISFVHLINSVMKIEEICRSNLFDKTT